ncbi:MAG: endonuclease dU [Candidatus Bathyarchaeia archaeon]
MQTSKVQVSKRGIRVLGVSESFIKGKGRRSVLAGVVMRGDLVIDGFSLSRATVGGMDATDSIIDIYLKLGREDISLILLNGCVISWFNIISLGEVHSKTGLPLICVTYEESEGLEKYFKEYFGAESDERIIRYRENGEREALRLHTGKTVFARYLGLNREDTLRILNRFTVQGGIPDPLRVARLLARTIVKHMPETID